MPIFSLWLKRKGSSLPTGYSLVALIHGKPRREKLVGSTALDKDKQNHITLTVNYSISTHSCFCQSQQEQPLLEKESWGNELELGGQIKNLNFYFLSWSLRIRALSALFDCFAHSCYKNKYQKIYSGLSLYSYLNQSRCASKQTHWGLLHEDRHW